MYVRIPGQCHWEEQPYPPNDRISAVTMRLSTTAHRQTDSSYRVYWLEENNW